MNLSLNDHERRLLTRFDTCFFERYAKLTLEYFLGEPYERLENLDRPDLQMTDGSLGIEVTRAMKESKIEAIRLVNGLAAEDVISIPKKDSVDIEKYGYAYGISEVNNVGNEEYRYWRLALPLKRILDSKVRKVTDSFYGDFDRYGLYIFTKDEMTDNDIHDALAYVASLQVGAEKFYSTIYISQAHTLSVCEVGSMDVTKFFVPDAVSRMFYRKALCL